MVLFKPKHVAKKLIYWRCYKVFYLSNWCTTRLL